MNVLTPLPMLCSDDKAGPDAKDDSDPFPALHSHHQQSARPTVFPFFVLFSSIASAHHPLQLYLCHPLSYKSSPFLGFTILFSQPVFCPSAVNSERDTLFISQLNYWFPQIP